MNFSHDLLRGLVGVAGIIGIAWLCSGNRRAVDWKLVGGGLLVQALLVALFLIVPGADSVFNGVANFFVAVIDVTTQGSDFVFGPLAHQDLTGTAWPGHGFLFAFQVLPVIIFFSALTSVLYYMGILQRVVFACAWTMKKFMRVSGAESLAAAAEIFLGQTESPLLIKPYLATMTRSELLAVMTGGMATIAGSVMVAYIGILGGNDPAAQQAYAKFLLCASIINAPASLIIAKLILPETEPVNEDLHVPKDRLGANFLDALANGTSDGLKLALNVGAMLIAFIAVMALVNLGLEKGIGNLGGGWLNHQVSAISGGVFPTFSLQSLCGYLFAPVAWLIGVESGDLLEVGSLMGKKLILNEFVAYIDLGHMKEAHALGPKSVFLATFALCGFANFASIGIQLGGTGGIAPEQRPTIAALGFKALLGGTLATLLSASLAGIFFSFVH